MGGESNGGCPGLRDGVALDLEQGPKGPTALGRQAPLLDDLQQPANACEPLWKREPMQVRPVLSRSGRASLADRMLGPDCGPHVCTLLLVRVNTVRNVTRRRSNTGATGGPTPLSSGETDTW